MHGIKAQIDVRASRPVLDMAVSVAIRFAIAIPVMITNLDAARAPAKNPE